MKWPIWLRDRVRDTARARGITMTAFVVTVLDRETSPDSRRERDR
jgi:hypothetical protein